MKRSIIVVALLAGCGAHRPLIDTAGVDMNRLEADLRQCQQYAQQLPGAGESAALGAGAGYLFGQILCRTLGGRNADCAGVGRATAITAGTGVAAESAMTKMQVVNRCMAGRGYRVLN